MGTNRVDTMCGLPESRETPEMGDCSMYVCQD
jgi:hypothetical protein